MKIDKDKQTIIIYNTAEGKASVSLYAKDGMVWMNQNQLAELKQLEDNINRGGRSTDSG
ncbi:hypothetical protein KKA14_12790 [bacterium]|nr:hypothetical protein [bacterium]